MPQPQSQPYAPTTTSKTLPVVDKQATLADITSWFSPRYLSHYARQSHKCYFEQVPTLYDLNLAYGTGTAQQWLVPFLQYINGAVTAERKMNSFQMRVCADTIVNNFGYIKLTEFMLFVSRLLGGTYGKAFYNSVDPMAITTALHDGFLPQRNAAYDNHQARQVKEVVTSALEHSKTPEEISSIVNRINSMIHGNNNKNNPNLPRPLDADSNPQP